MLNDASVASVGSYVSTCRRIRNSKKIATIRDFHQNICVNPTSNWTSNLQKITSILHFLRNLTSDDSEIKPWEISTSKSIDDVANSKRHHRLNEILIFRSSVRKDLTAACFVSQWVSQCVKLLVYTFCIAHIFLTQWRIRFICGVLMPYNVGNTMGWVWWGQRSLSGSCWMKR